MLPIQAALSGPDHHALLLAAAAFLIVLALAVLRICASRLRATLLPQRPGHTEDSFVHHTGSIGLHPRIARTTYRYLQRTRNVRFPILLGDELQGDLGLDRRAIAESLRDLLLENGRIPRETYPPSALATVEDLVAFIQSSPREDVDLAA